MGKKVSVLMCIYKEPIEWIKQSLRSLINQTYNNIEIIIIVDNPNNIQAINYVDKISKNLKYVKYHVNFHNLGLVKSLNKGLRMCKGDYIARMDADDISRTDRIQKQVAYLNKNNLDLVGCQVYLFDDSHCTIAKTVFNPVSCRMMMRYSSCIAHPSWLAKREVYEKLKGYRNIDACEDYDFIARAIICGFKVANSPLTLLKYRINPNSISNTKACHQYAMLSFISSYFRNDKIAPISKINQYIGSNNYYKEIYAFSLLNTDISWGQKINELYKCKEGLSRVFFNQLIKLVRFTDRMICYVLKI